MRHNMKGRVFGRHGSHRMAMLMNLSKSLLEHERITTTLPKAKDLRPFVEKLITIAKDNSLTARRRLLAAFRGDDKIVAKTMTEIATRYASRNGGYTRILRAGFRQGDNAPVAIIELLDNNLHLVKEKMQNESDAV